MKKRLLLAIMAVATLSSCSSYKRMIKRDAMTISPIPMELRSENGTLDIDYTLTTPKKYIKKGGQVVFTPKFTSSTKELSLGDVVISGKRFNRKEEKAVKKGKFIPYNSIAKVVINKKEAIAIDVNETIACSKWLEDSELYGYTYYNNGRKNVYLYKQLMADGVECVREEPKHTAKQEQKSVVKEVKNSEGVTILFKIDSYMIDMSLSGNKAELMAVAELINKTMQEQHSKVTSVVITGIASPDGPYQYNQKLSKERAQSAKEYLVHNCDVPLSVITVKSVAEDWDGLCDLIQKSNLSDRAKLLESFKSNISDQQKNIILYKSPNFATIAKEMLPQLRKVTYEVHFTTLK